MSCGIGCRCSSDPALLRLWCRPAAAAPILPLAWDLLYVAGADLKKEKKKKIPTRTLMRLRLINFCEHQNLFSLTLLDLGFLCAYQPIQGIWEGAKQLRSPLPCCPDVCAYAWFCRAPGFIGSLWSEFPLLPPACHAPGQEQEMPIMTAQRKWAWTESENISCVSLIVVFPSLFFFCSANLAI